MGDVATEGFVLYLTDKGLVHISNDIRVRILDELDKRSLSLSDLVDITGKAQSTLSVHLDKMVKDGVIKSQEDPEDNRRKMYSISSIRLAETKSPVPESLDRAAEIFTGMSDEPETISNFMISFIYVAMDSIGLSIGPFSEGLGSLHARALEKKFCNGPIDEVIDNVRRYYSFANMGKVSIFSFKPLTLTVDLEFKVSKGAAENMGRYAVGYFKTALESVYGRPYTMTSSEVFGPDNNYYRFVLENTGT